MSVETHPSYPEESKRLVQTLIEAEHQLAAIRAVPALDIPELVDEAMEAILVRELALERLRRVQLRRMEVAVREPYFGRLDYQEQDRSLIERLYIGKAGVQDQVTDEPTVIDWRAPIASIFYNTAFGGSETVSFESPDGTKSGQLHLKRNFGIKQGLLQRIVDSKVKGAPDEGEPIIDEFLQYRLQESRDSRLRDIVSTIQGEQNAIIRAPMDRPLIIQGVAGSGKTTVALHRLAYLLYTFRETVLASRVVIFAPNRMFLDYISEVLPELGVDGAVQTTFADWAMQELGEEVRLTDSGERLSALFAPGKDPSAGDDAPGRFKGSLFFRAVLDRALFEYEQSIIPDSDVELWPGAVLPQREVTRWFNENRSIYPVLSCKELVISRIKKWAENQALRYAGTSKEQERKKLSRSQVQKYLKLWPGHTVVELYRQILGAKPSRGQKLADVGAPDVPPRVSAESLTYFQRDEILPEDLAPLVYLKGKLRGFKDQRQLDHIVIDEAQDFSPFQVDLLRMLTRNNSFTILGDLSQGIHAYQGIKRWDELIECFEPEPTSYFTLESSYRSTFEIMTYANHVISAVGAPAALAKPVFRAGAPVRVVAAEPGALASHIAETITAMQARQIASIAVIGRTEAACAELYLQLVAQGLELELITARQVRYKGGLSIMPAYLTKGLEFDGVIIADAEPWAYGLTLRDSKLLYVACTRALHELVLFHGGAPSPLLPQVE